MTPTSSLYDQKEEDPTTSALTLALAPAPHSLKLPALLLVLSDESVPPSSTLSSALLLIAPSKKLPSSSNIRKEEEDTRYVPPDDILTLVKTIESDFEKCSMSIKDDYIKAERENKRREEVIEKYDQRYNAAKAKFFVITTSAAATVASSVSEGWSSRLMRQASLQSLELEPPVLSSVL